MGIKSKVINNAKWIIICKVIQSLLQLVIGMLCARYLGPENYGLINYASSIVAFVLPIMQLGLQSTLVQEFTEKPHEEGKIMGTALVMDLVSSVFCIGMVGVFVSVANAGETQTIIVCLLFSISLIFRAFELLQCWFQYKLKSKFPSIVMLCAYMAVSLYRIFLLVTSKNVFWFAVVNSVDYGIIGIALLIIYNKISTQKLEFSLGLVKTLFSRSKYYIMASMMMTLFQNTDHIMLKLISGDAENGFYTAAITCATILQFVFIAIVDSMRPVILAGKQTGSADYEKNLSRLYCVTIYMGLAQGIGFSIFAKLMVYIMYGAEFMPTVPVLQVLAWYIIFSYMGPVRNIWILAEGKQSILWKINLAGALMNVAINALLIPVMGAVGAAAASLFTQIFTNFILGFIVKPLRENNKLMLKGLNPKYLLDAIKG
ncbi:MAG: flippase [Ruminococcus sp.]|nr:flippase [Ruminococcus sp.]